MRHLGGDTAISTSQSEYQISPRPNTNPAHIAIARYTKPNPNGRPDSLDTHLFVSFSTSPRFRTKTAKLKHQPENEPVQPAACQIFATRASRHQLLAPHPHMPGGLLYQLTSRRHQRHNLVRLLTSSWVTTVSQGPLTFLATFLVMLQRDRKLSASRRHQPQHRLLIRPTSRRFLSTQHRHIAHLTLTVMRLPVLERRRPPREAHHYQIHTLLPALAALLAVVELAEAAWGQCLLVPIGHL